MLKAMDNPTRIETFILDPSLGQVEAFTREKTKSFVSRNIDDKVENLTNYKKRAEMLERKESLNFSSKRKEICTSSQTLEDNPREHERVPPNSPNIQEFEFDCWDYFSSIFFKLFPGDHDGKRRDVRPKSEGFCRDKSLDMWKEMEWRVSREKLRESITRSKNYDDGHNLSFSEGQASSKQAEKSENRPKKKISVDEQKERNAAERDYEVKKSNDGRQSNRYKLVLPEKPRNPFLRKSLINRERTKNAELFKSMEKTYEDIKKLKPGDEKRKQILAFTKDNTCSVYFSQTKHERQTVPVSRGLKCTANIIPKAIQNENSDLFDVVQTGDVDKKCLIGKKFDDEVKECLVTCSFRLNNKSEMKKNDIPKGIERNKVSYPQNKNEKRNKKQDEHFEKKSNDKGHGQKEILVSSPKLSENILGRRNSLFTEKKKADKMSKYRKNSKEQDFVENSQVLELKTKQFEFPAFQKSELLVDQVKRVTFTPLPILTSKFTYKNKDYDAWSRNDKKTVKPKEIKWKM